MRVLFTSLREKSHFLPLLPFLGALQERGHDVAVAAPPEFAERVGATGAEFLPFGHPGDEPLLPIWSRLRDAAPDELVRIVVSEIFAGACAQAALPSLLDSIRLWRPTLIVRESCEFAGLLAAKKLAVPHLRVAIFSQVWEEKIRVLAAAAVDEHGRKLGLAPDPQGQRVHDEPAVTLFPSGFEALQPSSVVHRFRLERRAVAPPLPDWWAARQGPFVYVTLGMVTGGFEQLRAAYRVSLEALAQLPIRVLMTIGSELPLDALGELPPNVHVERFVPQDTVLPHAAAVLCHGGSGTVLGALAAGAPLVVTPMFADQPYNAERVVALGAGVALPLGTGNAETLKAALTRVLGDESLRSGAQKMAREIATLPTVHDAVSVLERLARA